MPTPTNEVIRTLEGFGAKLGEFVQSREGSRLAAGQVDEGFCKGVCIDWTRRVLQSDKPAFTEKEERKTKQAVRQATLQLNIESQDSAYNALVRVSNELAEAYNRHLDRTPVEISQELERKLREYIGFTGTPNRTYAFDSVTRWLALLKDSLDAANHTTEVGFREFVRVMDEQHLEIRREQARMGSSRPFSHLKILASQGRTPYTTIRTAVQQLLNVDGFVVGTVLILGFGLTSPTSDAGHAVAVHKVTNTKRRFLDPNYGVFEYDSTGVSSALNYLFGTHYGTPIYGEDDNRVTGSVSYMLVGLTDD